MDWLPKILAIVLVALLLALVFWAAFRMVRMFLQAMRSYRLQGAKYEPIEDPSPAAPVENTAGIKLVALLVLLWAAAHVAAAIVWAATGYVVPRRPTWFVPAAYAVVASLVAAGGAVMLLLRKRGGRKAVTLGQFLLCLLAFFLLAACLVATGDPRAPEELHRIGYWLAGLFGLHIVIDTALGTLAQRLARPAGWSDAAGRVVEKEK